MGVGFVLVVKAKDATGIIEYLNNLGEEVYAIGKIDVGRGISFI
jgi:phosphoribosylaminoimidazole (AIR) synthetase